MTNTGMMDLDPNFMSLWSSDLHLLHGQRLASFPGNGGFAGNRLLELAIYHMHAPPVGSPGDGCLPFQLY